MNFHFEGSSVLKHSFLAVAIIVFLSASNSFSVISQTISAEDSLKSLLPAVKGTDQVDLLIQISNAYGIVDPDSAYYYALRAESIADELDYVKGKSLAIKGKANYFINNGRFQDAIEQYDKIIQIYTSDKDQAGLIDAYYNRGKLYRISGDYDKSLADMLTSLRLSEETDNKSGIAYAYLNIGIIYATRLGESSEAGLPYFMDALEISREINDPRCIAFSLNNIALVHIDIEEYDKALEYHRESLALRYEKGDKEEIAAAVGNIADVYTLKEEYDTAIKYNRQALQLYRDIDDRMGITYGLLEVGRGYMNLGNYEGAWPFLEEALSMIDEINSLQLISGIYEYLHQYYEETEQFEEAHAYHELYKNIEDSIYTVQSGQQIAEMRTQYETEKKEAEIIQLTNERTIQDLRIRKAENLRTFFIIALILTVFIAIFAYYGYYQKQRANKYLEMRNRFEIENKKRAISLFGQQVSKEVALELLSDSFKSGSKKLFACIMFLDIRDFTPFVADKDPADIIQYQNDVFGFMIDTISKHHGIINQFMGDGFMATFGAPASSGNDCQNAVNASIEIVNDLSEKVRTGTLPATRVGIGLHAGHIVTGNVGTPKRKQYSITGNTVILASRIEQLNKDVNSEILISREVFENIDSTNLVLKNLGTFSLKGRTEPIEIIRIG